MGCVLVLIEVMPRAPIVFFKLTRSCGSPSCPEQTKVISQGISPSCIRLIYSYNQQNILFWSHLR